MNNINILVEAKKEYTNQLQKILTPRIYEGFKSIYEDIINILSKELEENRTQTSSLIKMFQKMLKDIPQWNHEVIKTEYSRIEKLSNCDYIDNLIEAVFITNTKILTSVQINDSKSLNIKISVPQPSHFIHKCYMECAKEIYKNPYIFDQSKNLTPKEKHNNLREILHIIDNSINNAVRDLLPIRDILKQGLTKNNENIENEESYNLNNNKKENNTKNEEEKELSELTNLITEEKKDYEEENDEEEKDEEDEVDEDEVDEEEVDEEEVDEEEVEEKEEVEEEKEKEEVEEEKEKEEESKTEDIIDEFRNNTENEKKIVIEEVKKESNQIVIGDSQNETKEIIYNKVTPSFVKKIKNIEKIDSLENNLQDNFLKTEKKIENQEYKKDKEDNPFLKKIKNKIFLKKIGGTNKNNSFYKKKYEENSANYISISDSSKNNLENSVLTTQSKYVINEKKEKITKNKIMIDMNSSDEEMSHNDEIDI
jgi:hypothetical protein